jgi:ABC-type lipoprotein export system ATPase subunit
MNFLLAQNLCDSCPGDFEPLAGVTVGFEAASFNLLFGGTGSGRNRLLRLLGLMERPQEGEIVIDGKSTRDWTGPECAEFRSRHFGFLFETPLLIPNFNVAENIAMPLFKLTEANAEQARQETQRVLAHVGLPDEGESTIESLPLWAQQRVALARALVIRPRAILVENLDTFSRDGELIALLDLLSATRQKMECCIIATATHRDLSRFAQRVIEMKNGRMVGDTIPGGPFS